MKKLRIAAAMGLAAILGACGGTIVEERPVRVNTPVVLECAGDRPEEVTPLKREYPDASWAKMDTKQKAAAVSLKGLQRLHYSEQLDAATAGCP